MHVHLFAHRVIHLPQNHHACIPILQWGKDVVSILLLTENPSIPSTSEPLLQEKTGYNFLSVAVIKCPDRKLLRKENDLFGLQFQITGHSYREVTAAGA